MNRIEIHPIANMFPLMQAGEFDELKEDIANNGLQEAIWLHPDGRIIDGRNRYNACIEIGVTPEFRTWNGQGSLVAFVVSLNLKRRHLNSSQKAAIAPEVERQFALEAKEKENERKTTFQKFEKSSITAIHAAEQAARALGTNRQYVSEAKRIERDAPDVLEAVRRGDVKITDAKIIAELPQETRQSVLSDIQTGIKPSDALKPHVAHNSGNNEWYTPAEYIQAARDVMGTIDLDPASNPYANQTVQAIKFYTPEENGLHQEWTGKVWMNPPYESGLIGEFCAKLARHITVQDVPESIVLVNNATETAWFQMLIEVSQAVIFPRGRIRFNSSNGKLGAPLQGQALLYSGPQTHLFLTRFSMFGWGGLIYAKDTDKNIVV